MRPGRILKLKGEKKQEISEKYYKLTVEEYLKNGYNEYEAQIRTLKELVSKFDIVVEEVSDDDV